MKRTRSRNAWLVALALLVFAGLVLQRLGYLQPVEAQLFRVIAPLESPFASLGQGVSNLTQTLRDLRDLRARNEQLTELVNELAVDNVRLKELEAENETLRRLLDYSGDSTSQEFKATEVRARVLGWEPTSLLQYIVIGAGMDDGLQPGMPVVTERGLVGRVEEVFPKAARVRLIIDTDSAVNALVQRTRSTGVIAGQPGGKLLLNYLPPGEDNVSVGDLVLTSGLGGTFPRQLVIGQITAISQKDYEMFQQAEVRPTVDFERLEVVLVITNFIPLKLPAAAPGAASEEPPALVTPTALPPANASPTPAG